MARLPSGPFAGTPRELQQQLAAERTGRPFLVWRASDKQLQITHLEPARWRVTIGRSEDADVPLTHDTQVSRTHAILELVGEEWTLVDDGLSRNGSFVNAERVLGRHRLADGDRLCFGSTEVIYRSGAKQAAGETASVRDDPASMTLSPMQRRVLVALCRPVHDSESATPATNRDIAAEVFLSIDAVKAHLRVLFERFGLSELPQNEKRAQLVASVLVSGLLSPREF
jgi:pSer/pThr/pTyr-binding forkhead associated (FHA) protein